MPTHDRTLDELLTYLASYPGPRPRRRILDDAAHAYAAGLLTDGEYENVVGHIADDLEARGERVGPRLWPGPEAGADDNRDAGGEA